MSSDKIDPVKKAAKTQSIKDNAMKVLRETRAKIDPKLLKQMQQLIKESQKSEQQVQAKPSPLSGQDMIPVDKGHMQDIVRQYLELVPSKRDKLQ